MLHWTFRTLWQDRLNVLSSACGIALALLLALFLDGVFRGEADQIVAFDRHTQADVWVLQKGVENLHMTHSRLTEQNLYNVATVPGVETTVPLIYSPTPVGEPGRERIAYAVGVPAGATGVGPWSMAAGVPVAGPGQAVVPAPMADAEGLDIGDRLRIDEEGFEIAGLSLGTFSMANPLVFLAERDARRLFDIADGASVLLVRAMPGVAPETLAARIKHADGDVNPVVRERLIALDYGLALEMGGELVQLMSIIGMGVAGLIVVFSAYAFVAVRRGDFAVAKALGASRIQLVSSALAQTAVVSLLGGVIAAAVLVPSQAALAALVPQVAVHFSFGVAAQLASVAVVVAELAALMPVAQILRVDPVLVFNG